MHEMVVTKAMLDMALEHAEGRRVTDITLQIGEMSAVVPGSVQIFFKYLSKGTQAEGAELHFETLPLEMTCKECGKTMDLSAWKDLSPHGQMEKAFIHGCECGSDDLEVTGGVRFGLKSIDVAEEDGE
jgi:hydrogenase nickel incorporation protein HypA/HybF